MSGYPTREQAERIASSECDTELCHECDIMRWCTSDTMDLTSASRACGASMLAMHDEIDRLLKENQLIRAEIKRLVTMANAFDAIARVECIRKETNRSMREMAVRCGVSTSTYSRWIAGHDEPDMESMRRINYCIERDAPLPGSNVSQAQLDKIHFDSMQDWE